MLKKRLLASAMASIMAVTSLGATAIADDAAATAEATTAATAVKTKADLKTLVDSYSTKFREETIYDYATSTGINMINALDYADLVLEDEESDDADFTAAYLMVTEVAKDLVLYSAADVKDKVAAYKKTYETENILNEERNDFIYSTDSFNTFAEAYDNAATLSSSDSQIVCDAYVELVNAYNNLSKLDTVSKTQYAALIKKIDKIYENSNKYEEWRRGGVSGQMDGWKTDPQTKRIANWAEYSITWGDLLGGVYKQYEGTLGQGSYNGNFTKEYQYKYAFAAGWWAPVIALGDVKDITVEKYDEISEIKTSNKTSDPEIVDVFKAATDAVAVVETFDVDSYSSARKATVTSLIKEYKGRIITTYGGVSTAVAAKANPTLVGEVYQLINEAFGEDIFVDGKINDDGSAKVKKTLADGTKITTFYIQYDKETGAALGIVKNAKDKVSGSYYKSVNAGNTVYLYDYIDIEAAYATYADINDKGIGAALDLAYSYITDEAWGNAAMLALTSSNDDYITIAKYSGSTTEWAVIYRNLRYALDDKFPSGETHSLSEMYDALQASYDCGDKKYESAAFADELKAVVDMRAIATQFYKLAKKDSNYTTGTSYTIEGVDYTSTSLYDQLAKDKGVVKKFWDKVALYPTSFGDIYDTIAEAAELIDSEGYDLAKLVNECAYRLSIVEGGDNGVNDDFTFAFEGDRTFVADNRVSTAKWYENGYVASHGKLVEAYNALVAGIEAAQTPKVTLGDVNGDGAVDMKDALVVMKVAVGVSVEYVKEAADFNNDTAVDVKDALAIMKAALA